MDPWIIYAIIAFGISLTSYINIYRPALDLYIEVTEDEKPIVGTFVYKIIWVLLTFIGAPLVAFMLIRGINEKYIRELVVAWIGVEDE